VGASLVGVLLVAKAAVLWNRPLVWSVPAFAGYVWQDALVVLVFAGLEVLVRRWRLGRLATSVVYGGIVLYAALNVAVAHVLSTPLTLPMIRAARGALADSIGLYLTWPNMAAMIVIVAVGATLPPLVGRARAAVPVLRSSPLPGVAAAVLIVVAVSGSVPVKDVDTAGLHRNAVVALVESALPRIAARAGEADWRAPVFEPPPADDLSALRGVAAGRPVGIVTMD
jgi:hypothetical protein